MRSSVPAQPDPVPALERLPPQRQLSRGEKSKFLRIGVSSFAARLPVVVDANSRRKTRPQTTERHEASGPAVLWQMSDSSHKGVHFRLSAPFYYMRQTTRINSGGTTFEVHPSLRYEDHFEIRGGRRHRAPVESQVGRRADWQVERRFAWSRARRPAIPHRSADRAARGLPTYLRDPEVGT